jgi:ABC-type transport system substrate-binding protein
VKWHDGSTLNASAVVASLGSALDGVWIAESPQTVRVELPTSRPDLPWELCASRYAVVRGDPGGLPVATGPFRVTEFSPGARLRLAAYDDYWGGRPFLDTVEIEFGRSSREQRVALETGRTDVILLSQEDVRQVGQRGQRVWTSLPQEVVLLQFMPNRLAADVRVREAVALAVDRVAIQRSLLHGQGEATGALLPQWMTGHAFLFSGVRDLERARSLVAALAPRMISLTLGYASGSDTERSIAERIAVDARQAGVYVRVLGQSPAAADLMLRRVSFGAADPIGVVQGLAAATGKLVKVKTEARSEPEALYRLEQEMLEGFWIVPLFHLPVHYGLSPRVRSLDFSAAFPAGGWRFEELWIVPNGYRQGGGPN